MPMLVYPKAKFTQDEKDMLQEAYDALEEFEEESRCEVLVRISPRKEKINWG